MVRRSLYVAAQSVVFVMGIFALGYAAYVTTAWYRFGHVQVAPGADALADRFMPSYDVREEHHLRVRAPAEITIAAARSVSFDDSNVVRAIFKGRELILRSAPETKKQPHEIVALLQSLGWRVLAEVPGREIVFGAVTQPWRPNVVFRSLAPSAFAAFHEPDYVKIVWTLRADPAGASNSVFRTETRAISTDAKSRDEFHRYWATFSPGIVLIRIAVLPVVKRQAEQRGTE